MKRLALSIILLFCMATAASAARYTFSGFVAKGAYDAGTVYALGDMVTDSGTTYLCFKDTCPAGTDVTNTAYYVAWLVKGDTGAQGPAGATGADGAAGADGAGITAGSDGHYGWYTGNNTSAFSDCTSGRYGVTFIGGVPYACINGTTTVIPTASNPTLTTGSSLSAGAGSGSVIPGSSLTAGSVYYQASGGLTLADADGTGTYPAICLASSTTACMYSGVYRFSSTQSWTVGGVLYLSTTEGGLTQTRPATTGNMIQRVGVALAADTILIMPSLDVGTAP